VIVVIKEIRFIAQYRFLNVWRQDKQQGAGEG
jgi:hypothetical protein